MQSRRTRQPWEITIACLRTINAAGKASRMQVYEIFKNERNLERWLMRLIDRWGIVKEIVSQEGHKFYTKTDRGEVVKGILIYHHDVIGPLKEILGESLRPIFLPQKSEASR